MELLAPAGDWDAMVAAINAGADAVYLGGKDFNARQSAANFDRESLKKAVEYLHLRGRRLYVTFNTLVAQHELADALEYAAFLRNIGVDAVIVQDIGMLSLIRELLPDLTIHASTQMTVHSPDGVRFLERLGVARVVLARELSMDDIKAISQSCQAELEVFVHGALCISYSGACLFSSMIGGRSGNRGRCAQPCRLEYELLKDGHPVANERGPHLLSPKDLCLIEHLVDLRAAGVHSLKIEGRMKGPEYVGTVVRAYRQTLDKFQAEKGLDFAVDPGVKEDLTSVFNRGFTSGYFEKNLDRQGMSPGRPSNRGQFIGRIVNYDAKSGRAVVELQAELLEGDGLEFWVTRGGRRGQLAEDIRIDGKPVAIAPAGSRISIPMNGEAYPGDRVFRTSSVRIRRALEETEAGRLPCRAFVKAVTGQSLSVMLYDEEGHMGSAESTEPLAYAIKRPVTFEMIEEQIGRLGETPFRLAKLDVQIEGGPMVPLSMLNALRREAVADLEKQRLTAVQRPILSRKVIGRRLERLEERERRSGEPKISVWAGSPEAVRAAAEAGAERVYFGGDELLPNIHWDAHSIAEATQACRRNGREAVLALPRITRCQETESIMNYCRWAEAAGTDGLLLAHPGQYMTVRTVTDLPCHANHTFNIFNAAFLALLSKQGFAGATLSTELTLAGARQLWETRISPRLSLELVVHGALELMISQFCPIAAWSSPNTTDACGCSCRKASYALRDRKGYIFPVYSDQYCRTHLLNSADLVMVGDLYRFAGQDLLLRLELRERSAREVAETVNLYRDALSAGAGEDDREALIARAHRISGREMTRGHYFRGVD